jgi:hypothetical protein
LVSTPYYFFGRKNRKLLIRRDLSRPDMRVSAQNIENKGLARKIFKSKEIAVLFLLFLVPALPRTSCAVSAGSLLMSFRTIPIVRSLY